MALRAVQGGTGRVRTQVRGGVSGPALLANFSTGTAPASLVYSRTSQATTTDSSGNVVYGPNNLALQSENFEASSTYTPTGAAVTASATTPPSGLTKADALVEDTAAASPHSISDPQAYIAGASYMRLVRVKALPVGSKRYFEILFRSNAFGSNMSAMIDPTNGTVTTNNAAVTAGSIPLANGWYLFWASATATISATATDQLRLAASQTGYVSSYTGDGVSGVYVSGYQVAQITPAQTAANVAAQYLRTTSAASYGPRFTYVNGVPAFLPEGATTNQIRNSTGQGSVAGNPGTVATNWTGFQTGGTGLSRNVIGAGTLNGVSGVYIQVSGTPSANGTYQIQWETSTGVAALTGQGFVNSVYAAITAGSLTNVSSVILGANENTSGGAFVTNDNSSALNLTGTLTRFSYAFSTKGGATVAALQPGFVFNVTSGLAVNFTVFVGLPQLETALTTPVPTYGTALNRAAEVAYLDVSGLGLTSSGYTIVQKGYMPPAPSATNVLLYGSQATNQGLNVFTSGTTFTFSATDTGGTTAAPNINTALAAGASYKYAMRVQPAGVGASINGGAVGTATGTSSVRVLDKLYLGYFGSNGTAYADSPISSVAIYGTPLVDAQLQALST